MCSHTSDRERQKEKDREKGASVAIAAGEEKVGRLNRVELCARAVCEESVEKE